VQAEQAEEQTTTVTRLRQQVEKGEAPEEELELAEGLLAGLTGSLQYMQAEMDATLRGADVAFRRGLLGTKAVCSALVTERFLTVTSHQPGASGTDTVRTSPCLLG
jgi:hypothetical protein